ncbi:MAG: hypothetical protein ACEQSA_05665, partial [Weeksellaceae bacterium]
MSDITFTKLSWQDLQHDCLKLYTKLDGIQIDHIISITRGGDVVARIFSDLLGNIQISHITLSYPTVPGVQRRAGHSGGHHAAPL